MTTPVRTPVSPAAPRPKMTKSEAGKLGMLRRYGPHGRILRLDQLEPTTKTFVLALLDAAAAKAKADAADRDEMETTATSSPVLP